MPLPDPKSTGERSVRIAFSGRVFDAAPSETVLETLIREGVDVPHSCRKGTCLTCIMRVTRGEIPDSAQEGLGQTLRAQGYVLACQCPAMAGLEIASPDEAAVYARAKVVAVDALAPTVRRVLLEPAVPVYYHAGQFINLRRRDGLVRSYSLASVPSLDSALELHVKWHENGTMSGWIFERLQPGESVDFQGPNGACYYLPGQPDQPMLLIGSGTGLAPLIGIVRDALQDGHAGPIHLYHGSRTRAGLYLGEALGKLAAGHRNFHYHPCLSGAPAEGCRQGRADEVALTDRNDLKGWRVFLCGHPEMVKTTNKLAFLAGADLGEIHADPYELRDLRAVSHG